MSGPHILIVGCGSAGKRHARNLAGLGCRITSIDPRDDRRRELEAEIPLVGGFASLDAAIASGEQADGVVIASPPAFHVDQSIEALEAGLPVLLEKPVSPALGDAERLLETQRRTKIPLLLGYTWRWWPPMVEVRRRLGDGAIGAVRHVNFVMSAHLADWHPWEDYRSFFMARQALGGGALLDESHWIDLMIWFFGMPTSLSAAIDKISDLDIDTDDNVDMMLSYPDGLRVTMHLDLYGRPHQKFIRFVGEAGAMLWSENPNRIAMGAEMGETWQETDYDCERNDMFVEAGKEFLRVLDGAPVGTCALEDGIAVLRVVEAARRSHGEGCVVVLGSGG